MFRMNKINVKNNFLYVISILYGIKRYFLWTCTRRCSSSYFSEFSVVSDSCSSLDCTFQTRKWNFPLHRFPNFQRIPQLPSGYKSPHPSFSVASCQRSRWLYSPASLQIYFPLACSWLCISAIHSEATVTPCLLCNLNSTAFSLSSPLLISCTEIVICMTVLVSSYYPFGQDILNP